jgi:hypothetical protein
MAMNRLQKKCFIASAGMHFLLAVVFFLSSGFIASRSKPVEITPLNFVPSILLESDIRGGGNPKASPPPPSSPPQATAAPAQQTEKAVPEPPKPKEREVRQPAPAEDPAEPSLERKHEVQVSTTLKTRSHNTDKATSTASDSAAEQAKAAAARREMANRIGRAVADIGQASSATTSIEDFGPNGGGPAYAGYAAYVQAIYLAAWVPPDDTSASAAIAKATVTIARDGTIVSRSLTKRSGDSQIDSSIQRALERVSTIGRPFPDGMNDKERTYILKFDLTVKRQT